MMATRTEHAGAKNGGGYWGKRAEAKRRCRRLRRKEDRIVKLLEQLEDLILGEMARKALKEKGGITLEQLRKKLNI
jgi:hypothetical protein